MIAYNFRKLSRCILVSMELVLAGTASAEQRPDWEFSCKGSVGGTAVALYGDLWNTFVSPDNLDFARIRPKPRKPCWA
jgi:hypothetical protein